PVTARLKPCRDEIRSSHTDSFRPGALCRELFGMAMGNEREGQLRSRTAHGVVPREIGIPEEARDDVLLRRAAKGDEDAFTVLYRRHQAAIYRFALRMTGNSWASEEIVQDVFMTLMREPKKYDPERGALAAYLYGIARNRVMKHLERLPREVQLDDSSESGVHAIAGLTNVV